MNEYLLVALRAITVMSLFLLLAIILGKRHIAEMSIFDVITLVTLGSIAGADLADPKVPHGPTVLALVLLAALHVGISRLILKNRPAGRLLSFDPTIVIQRGVIQKASLSRLRYTVDELISHLRQADVFDIGEVEYAILEPDGKLSVLKRPSAIMTNPELSLPVILEGRIRSSNLVALGLTPKWMEAELSRLGYTEREIFLGMANASGKLYISPNQTPIDRERLDH